jgi:hypothetical protein
VPEHNDVVPDDFSAALQLMAHCVEFQDPMNGIRRRFNQRMHAGRLIDHGE